MRCWEKNFARADLGDDMKDIACYAREFGFWARTYFPDPLKDVGKFLPSPYS
jgi:hypothetical protein